MAASTSRPSMEDKEKQIAQCNTCKLWLPFEKFQIIRSQPNRRWTQSSCRECCNAWKKNKVIQDRKAYSEEELSSGCKTCRTCKETKPLTEMQTYRGVHYVAKYMNKCKDCVRKEKNESYARRSQRTKDWHKRMDCTIRGRAMRINRCTKGGATHRGIPYSLDLEWILDRLHSGVCEITGVPFLLKPGEDTRNLFAPSVERVDPTGPYSKDNCKLVVFGYNVFKNDGTHDDAVTISEGLLRNSGYEVRKKTEEAWPIDACTV